MTRNDIPLVFQLLESEGADWEVYCHNENKNRYRNALKKSFVHVAMEKEKCIGYVRYKTDEGFGITVFDLLVGRDYRGHQYGKKLLESVSWEYPSQTIYVMSDEDAYYQKLGYHQAGTIFIVTKPE